RLSGGRAVSRWSRRATAAGSLRTATTAETSRPPLAVATTAAAPAPAPALADRLAVGAKHRRLLSLAGRLEEAHRLAARFEAAVARVAAAVATIRRARAGGVISAASLQPRL